MNKIIDHKVTVEMNFPHIDPKVHRTDGITYLKSHGVALIGQTVSAVTGLESFLHGFHLDYDEYLKDPVTLDSGALLTKFAGQMCYLSLGAKRTMNENADRYLDHVMESKHGSVFEHAVYSFLLYGIDRAVTHELVRHRAGTAFSQVSQRYVGPDAVRYVMPQDMQSSEDAKLLFLEDCRNNLEAYKCRIELLQMQRPDIEGESKTDKRKRMQSFARRALANEVEAPIVVSGNLRAWRHMFEMRAAAPADVGIRRPMFDVFRVMRLVCPLAFADFKEVQLPDGTWAATPKHSKV